MCKKDESGYIGIGLLIGVIGGIAAGVLFAPKSGKESRAEVKEALAQLAEKQSPNVKKAKKQALESIDLIRYKLERQFRKLSHMLKSKKMQKAKELEEIDYEFN